MKFSFKTLAINLAAFLFLAILVEAVLAFGLKYPSYIPGFALKLYRKIYIHYDRDIIQYNDCSRYDPGLFYTLKPGNCEFANREFEIRLSNNSLGLRDDEASLAQPEIVALGDSHTMGWGVQQNESYPEKLEQLHGVKVLNAGISSYGTVRELMMLQRIDRSKLTHVVIQYHSNDYGENTIWLENNKVLPIQPEAIYDSLAKLGDQRRYSPFKYTYSACQLVGQKLFRTGPQMKPRTIAPAEIFLEVINHSPVDLSQVELLVFKIDDFNHPKDDFLDQVDSLLTTTAYQGLKLCVVRTADIHDEDYYILDDHLNAKGHEKIARRIARALAADGGR